MHDNTQVVQEEEAQVEPQMLPNGPIMLAIFALVHFDWAAFDWMGLYKELALLGKFEDLNTRVDVHLMASGQAGCAEVEITVDDKPCAVVTVEALGAQEAKVKVAGGVISKNLPIEEVCKLVMSEVSVALHKS